MQIFGDVPEWNSDDASLLKEWLNSAIGQRVLAQVASTRPAFLRGADLNATALQAQEIAGYERCLTNLISLSVPLAEPKKTVEAYPPLDDDTQWNDGQHATQ